MEFANKEYLFLLLLLVPYIIWYLLYRKKTEPTIRMSDTRAYRFAPRSWKVMLMPVQLVLRLAVFVLLILILARPQTHNSWNNKSIEGIDIMLAMDVSGSMLAEDLRPNRIEAAKQVAAEFIAGRPNDNIGHTPLYGRPADATGQYGLSEGQCGCNDEGKEQKDRCHVPVAPRQALFYPQCGLRHSGLYDSSTSAARQTREPSVEDRNAVQCAESGWRAQAHYPGTE